MRYRSPFSLIDLQCRDSEIVWAQYTPRKNGSEILDRARGCNYLVRGIRFAFRLQNGLTDQSDLPVLIVHLASPMRDGFGQQRELASIRVGD